MTADFTVDGLQATGTFVLEYVGEVLRTDAYRSRWDDVYLGRRHYHCINLDGSLVIDGGRMGKETKSIDISSKHA